MVEGSDMTIPAAEALRRLREGNARFSASVIGPDAFLSSGHRAELVQVQEPIAIVLGCSDARVPAEIVFYQGLGALFVIRVAGNIVAPSQVGSVEFAAERFGTRRVVVLGHSQCGAVLATIEALRNPDAQASANLRSIVDRVRPSVEEILKADPDQEFDDLVHHAVRSNIRASVNHLRNGSELLERLISERGLMVVGAEYSLQTGKVEFFEGA